MKIAIYRENSVYTKYLATELASRPDFEVITFAEGTPDIDIASALSDVAEKIFAAEKVYSDGTCNNALRSLRKQTHFPGLDYYFQEAAVAALSKESVEETISEIVRRMLEKEVPDRILIVQSHMADHNLFGLGITSADWEAECLRDAEKLRGCLSEVSGQPVSFLAFGFDGIEADVSISKEDNVWVFSDRHFKSCEMKEWRKIPTHFKQFQVPIWNLVEDARAFGIDIDEEAFSKAIREIMANW